MIKNKKKDHKMKEPTEVNLRLEEGKIHFSLSGEEYFISKTKAVELFQPAPAVLTKQKTEGGDDFSDFNTVDFRAKYEVCYEHFGVLPVVATFLKVDESRLRAWINDPVSREMWRVKAWGHGEPDEEPGLVARTSYDGLKEKYRNEFFPPEKKEKAKAYSVNLKKIAKMLQEGKKPREIAEEMGVPWSSFGLGYMAHIKTITQLANKRDNLDIGEHNVKF